MKIISPLYRLRAFVIASQGAGLTAPAVRALSEKANGAESRIAGHRDTPTCFDGGVTFLKD